MIKKIIASSLVLLAATCVWAQTDTIRSQTLQEVFIQQRKVEGVSRLSGALNGNEIGQGELFRAACCNLGESFVTNPSVDINYNDAAVGSRQIKLLGLSGKYVQMLVENLPVSLGAAMPYSLGYVPGAWMKSISVSKGASSVRNGPQSITGQINVEYLKPDEKPGLQLNLYTDSRLRNEANIMTNIHINRHLSTELLAHCEKDFAHNDENSDGWHDSPNLNQLHLQNRWKYQNGRYIMHAGAGYLTEDREGGQLLKINDNPFRVLIASHRMEGYMKHALLLNREHNTNLALLSTGSIYHLDGTFGSKDYTNRQRTANVQLVLEHDFNEIHNLSTGLSFNADHIDELLNMSGQVNTEYTSGYYAQYTYKPTYKLTFMGGLRIDHSTHYNQTFLTPRLHAKWVSTDWMTLRVSTGKGYRSPQPLAENHYLLSSGRSIAIIDDIKQEEAWNSGLSLAIYIPLNERTLTLNAEYYYTRFHNQVIIDYDSDPTLIIISNLHGTSFSHTTQVDANYDITEELNILAAFRYNHVMCTYGGKLMEKPLQSHYKGLLTLSWKPLMALWQVDFTLQLNGNGRIPNRLDANGSLVSGEKFPAYPQLNLQVTREFRHLSVYIGGENLTNYRQPVPVINASNPWSTTFDPTLVWGPVHGIMAYAGVRMTLGK